MSEILIEEIFNKSNQYVDESFGEEEEDDDDRDKTNLSITKENSFHDPDPSNSEQPFNNRNKLYCSYDSLTLLETTYLRSNNLSFNILKNHVKDQKNNKSNLTITSGDSLYDVTLWTEQVEQNSEINLKEKFEKSGIETDNYEQTNWAGVVDINDYAINQDLNPTIIIKKCTSDIEYIQELVVRYLKPPTPPPSGEIIIIQEPNILTAPAPPLVIRQQPARPVTPQPLVIREAPPKAPAPIGIKLITISGKKYPPPPRKVVIERLAPLPTKPQSVIVEKWLPYSFLKSNERKLLFPIENQPSFVF